MIVLPNASISYPSSFHQISSDRSSCTNRVYERIKTGPLSFEACKNPAMICFRMLLFLFLPLIIVRDVVVVFDTRRVDALLSLSRFQMSNPRDTCQHSSFNLLLTIQPCIAIVV